MIINMTRTIFLCLLSLASFAASLEDPYQLVLDWKACRLETTLSPECKENQRLMTILHENVALLQDNPQQMGMKIMSVQNQIVELQSDDKPHEEKMAELQEQLKGLLSTVGWLESPK
jgi:peptidoglycan hydrolase CwlO-like protein